MGLRKMLCKFTSAATLAMVALVATGCASSTTSTARHRDWRESVKAGDFQSAYSDLYENWRAGTPDVRAETLRYAWRDPRIVAVAKPDLVAKMQPVADAHQGDLQALQRALRDGPLEDRIDFAKLVDRKLDVDREIASAYERRRQSAAQPVQAPSQAASPQPATPSAPVASPPPAAESHLKAAPQPATTPQAAAVPKPATTPHAAAAPQPATTPQPMAKPQSETKPQVAPAPQPKVEPTPVAKPAAKPATQSDHVAEVAEAKRRAVWRCRGAPACDKAWAAAESFVGLNTDMRIRTAKSPTIETYPPIEIGKVGMKVEKVPLENDEAELRLTVACRVGVLRQLCPATELRIYTSFPGYMQAAATR